MTDMINGELYDPHIDVCWSSIDCSRMCRHEDRYEHDGIHGHEPYAAEMAMYPQPGNLHALRGPGGDISASTSGPWLFSSKPVDR